MDIQNIEISHHQFIEKMKQQDPHFFKKLGEGQEPSFFVISCGDSRTCPSVITGMPLGEMFSHRNIGNQVSLDDQSFQASLEFSLDVLKVKYIIVLGHTKCGGVTAARTGDYNEGMKGWIKKIEKSIETYVSTHDHPEARELEEHNVRQQVINLKNHPVYQRIGEGIPIIGLLFDVESGELKRVNEIAEKTT
ncbi:carbonic anhydrase [Salipaludibacillus daqingensis]|uniref:carbonic anhydrase n=1 Tax=Salipaludibacillus daqingensis TaxID=3041001 RepID=UPI002473DA6C|nr:carbonic anhydrase [Salipaludibacillus daqingensis]